MCLYFQYFLIIGSKIFILSNFSLQNIFFMELISSYHPRDENILLAKFLLLTVAARCHKIPSWFNYEVVQDI